MPRANRVRSRLSRQSLIARKRFIPWLIRRRSEPCLEIEKNPLDAYEYTAKGNLVAVISNGTAVLGLGDIGPLAGKPVMEGKGLLFKIFAGIDVFDIEVNEKDPEKFIQTVKAISPTFGGINLEDIKAPSVSRSRLA